jgi:hypothetical protein
MEVFVQSNFDESTINLIVNKKLIEQQKNKNNLLKIEKNKKAEEVIKKNQSKDSWKEVKQNNINNSSINNITNCNNNQKYKKSKYKGHNNNYTFNYNNQNHSSHYYYPNKKYYRHSKNFKPYNRQKNYIEREIEFNSKVELDNEIIEDSTIEKTVSLSPHISSDSTKNSKNGTDVISQENSEETNTINNLELLNLNLSKCQSEELTHKNYDLHDVGIKLFPGIYKNKNYNLEIGKDNNSINNININNNYKNINNKEEEIKKSEDSDNFVDKDKCMNYKNEFKFNFLHKANSNVIRGEQKKGLALALDYYSSFLEDTKNNK